VRRGQAIESAAAVRSPRQGQVAGPMATGGARCPLEAEVGLGPGRRRVDAVADLGPGGGRHAGGRPVVLEQESDLDRETFSLGSTSAIRVPGRCPLAGDACAAAAVTGEQV